MRHALLSATSAALALSVSSAAVVAQQANPPAAAPTVDLCEELVRFVERRGTAQPASPVTLDQARGFQGVNNFVACRDGWVRIQRTGIALPAAVVAVVQAPATGQRDGTQITVQQPAPAIRVEQASPQVTVQAAQPQVTVRQPQPEILVRQPAPTVTVDIPQPEIVVRMPQPEVNVAQAQPQVSVNQPRPEVEVVRPSQPQVQVTPAQPQVLVQRPLNQEANVQVQQQGQPQIRYERAEPQVTVNQAQGQPQVRVEQQPTAGQGAAAGAVGTRQVRASELRDMDVVNARGEQIGDVERLVRGQDNLIYVVVGHGGFLGLGEKDVALPLDRMTLHGGRLVVAGLTDEQIRAMPALTRDDARYREVETTFAAPLRVAAVPPAGAGTAVQATRPGAVLDPAERRRLARERIGEDVASTGTIATGAAVRPPQTRTVRARELEDLNIYNARGELLGDVERVIVNPADNRPYAVIGHGGFLGLFEDEVALPLDRLFVRGDRIMIRGITDEELDRMPEWRNRYANARELDDNVNLSVAVER